MPIANALSPVHRRAVLAVQLLGTLGILAFVPTNLGKLGCLLVLWAVTFDRLTRAEMILYLAVCAFFTVMNLASLRQGIFSFTHPDVLHMPAYEFFMWGFYLLHTLRMLRGPSPEDRQPAVWVLATLYAGSFAAISDPELLLLVTAILLVIGIALFHERFDVAYVCYMIVVGAAIEYTGVLSGQWHYPGAPPGGVPLWFVTLWGGVGLFLRRLVLPVLSHADPSVAKEQG
jgi:hypothetical protein